MRVLYFTDNSSDHNRRFLEKIASNGNEVWFLDVTRDRPPVWSMPTGSHWLRPSKTISRAADPDEFESFVPELRSIVKQVAPDLIHAGPVQTCGYASALADVHPLIVMSWGSDLLLHAQRNEEWKRATKISLGAADGFVCDCDTVRAEALKYSPLPDSAIAQFPWGLKKGSFSPAGSLLSAEQLTISPGVITLLCTRAWEPCYGMDLLLNAFDLAYRQDSRLRLILLGDGSEAARVKDFIRERGLREVVLTPGVVQGSELPGWFRSANGYVSCVGSDGTSISLLEAMATGLPVVVTDNPSNREWVTPDESGWLAQRDSATDFAEKFLRLANLTDEERSAIATRNQEIVAMRADWDANFPRLLQLYESVVGASVKPRSDFVA